MAEEFDVIVIGAGAAGLSAALTASVSGLSVLVVEKTSCFGGTTSLSGGVIWIPNNHLMKDAGVTGTTEENVLPTPGDRRTDDLQTSDWMNLSI